MPTILVVDDAAADRHVVGKFLSEDPSLNIDFAADGAAALEKLAQAVPDLILTDLVMPRVDGFELVAEVRKRYPFVPVVLMTSQGSEEIAVQALRQGAASYVPKRRLGPDILDTVHSLLVVAAGRRGHARLMGRMTRIELAVALENDWTLVDPLVSYLLDGLSDMRIVDRTDRTRVGVAMREAVLNAIYHGNLEISSEVREKGPCAYHALAAERCRQTPYRDRTVQVEAKLSREAAVFVVRDEGRGFDPASLPDPTDPANLEKLSGRGILLMRALMDEVAFSPAGNEVTLIKRRRDGLPVDRPAV